MSERSGPQTAVAIAGLITAVGGLLVGVAAILGVFRGGGGPAEKGPPPSALSPSPNPPAKPPSTGPSAESSAQPSIGVSSDAGNGRLAFFYNFDGTDIHSGAQGERYVLDASGTGRNAFIRKPAGQAGDLGLIGHERFGKALTFPAPCIAATNVTCPRAIVEVADAALNPGTESFTYGANVLVQPAQSASSNIMQKGFANPSISLWKLEINASGGGRPSCVVVGKGSDPTNHTAASSVGIADGAWHKVTCVKTATTLTIRVDNVTRGTATLPEGLTIANQEPPRIGGKDLTQPNDQFFGALDNVFFRLG